MAICGVNDYCMMDYTKPDPKRLMKQLSAVINFAKFKEERLDMYHKITVPRDEHLDRLQQLTAENDQLRVQLEELREANKAQRQEEEEVDAKCAEVEGQVNELNKQQALLRCESADLKKQLGVLKEKQNELAATMEAHTSEKSKLESQVVHSPERVRREMHESQRALQQERREGETAEQAALVATASAKVVEDAIEVVQDATAAGVEIESETNKWQSLIAEIKIHEVQIAQNARAVSEKVQVSFSSFYFLLLSFLSLTLFSLLAPFSALS